MKCQEIKCEYFITGNDIECAMCIEPENNYILDLQADYVATVVELNTKINLWRQENRNLREERKHWKVIFEDINDYARAYLQIIPQMRFIIRLMDKL